QVNHTWSGIFSRIAASILRALMPCGALLARSASLSKRAPGNRAFRALALGRSIVRARFMPVCFWLWFPSRRAWRSCLSSRRKPCEPKRRSASSFQYARKRVWLPHGSEPRPRSAPLSRPKRRESPLRIASRTQSDRRPWTRFLSRPPRVREPQPPPKACQSPWLHHGAQRSPVSRSLARRSSASETRRDVHSSHIRFEFPFESHARYQQKNRPLQNLPFYFSIRILDLLNGHIESASFKREPPVQSVIC